MTDRTVPYDLHAERAVLGALLLERDTIVALAAWLSPDHFYLEKHAMVYQAALACFGRREPPDLATVATELRRREQIETIGGMLFLGELLAEVPSAVHAEYYARTVEQTAVARRLIEAGGKISAMGFDEARPIDDRLADAGQMVFRLSAQRQIGNDFVPLATVASEYMSAAAESEDAEEGLLGVPTGYTDLDRITQGMKAGELVVLAARPGMGKTALALNIASNVASAGRRVGIFSMEMDRELLMQRLLSMELGVPTNLIPRMVRRGSQQAINGLARLADLPIHIDHTAALKVLAIRDRARRLAADAPVGLWIVDYLQLAQGASESEDDVRRITAVSQGLTAMAREFRTPVLALSQLSRAVESRQSKVPQLSDLRGSGSIEQDASQVWFIYRDEMQQDPDPDKAGIADIYVSKHRNGETGVAALRFDRSTTRFHSLAGYRAPEGY